MITNVNPKKLLVCFLIALAVCLLVTSCGSVSKNKVSYEHKTDSVGTSVSTSNSIKQEDSISKKSNESKAEMKKEVEEKGGLKAVFGEHDPKTVTGPVKIESDSSGGYTIDPGGRPLESVFVPKTKKTTETRSKETKEADSTGVNSKTVVNNTDSSGSAINKNQSGKSIVKEREPFNWGGLIILSVIVAFIVVLIRFVKKKFRRVDNG